MGHGTCKLEKTKEGFSPHLPLWCTSQRTQMKRFLSERDRCNLDEERYERMRGIGFLEAHTFSIGPAKDWDKMFEELKAYKEEHGTVLVPHTPRSQLRNWIVTNREQYEKMKAGNKKSKMTVDRLQLLQELGLEMTCRERKGFDERRMARIQNKARRERATNGIVPTRTMDPKNS